MSASAIYLLAFGLLGLYEVMEGTILLDGIGITYPFPQKEFGEEVIRQMQLIELGLETTVVLLSVFSFDSIVRLAFNHLVGRPLGFLGSFSALSNKIISLVGGDREVESSLAGLKEKMSAEKHYKQRVSDLHQENQLRGQAAYSRFLARKEQ